MTTTAQRILNLHRRVHEVVDACDGPITIWPDAPAVYDFVFTEHDESMLNLTWHDPDASYEEDVLAFVAELDRAAAPYLAAEPNTEARDERADIVAFLQNTPARSAKCIVNAIRNGAHVGWSKR